MKTFRKNQVLPHDIYAACRRWPNIGAPCAWGAAEGHSVYGNKHGVSYVSLLKEAGFNMLPTHATHKDGSVALETSITDIQRRLKDGRLKIHPSCKNLIDELQDLERDEHGDLIPISDDLFSALSYLLMSLKSARSDTEIIERGTGSRPQKYATLDADAGRRYFGIDF